MLCDGYVEYQEVKVNGSAIMQNYENNEKKMIKNYRLLTISDFIYANLSLCNTLHFGLYSWSSAI